MLSALKNVCITRHCDEINKEVKMNSYKEHTNQTNQRSSEVEYIASRLSSVMETYKKLTTKKVA